jgi:hypothetical protein
MEFYKNRIKLKYFLNAVNKISDIKYLRFEHLNDLPYPSYFLFDCKYEYYHYKLKYYCNDEIVEEYLEMSIKINLYYEDNNYYIKFNDLFSNFNDKLLSLVSIYDYRELKLYDLHRDIEDLSEYIKINYGLDVRKD